MKDYPRREIVARIGNIHPEVLFLDRDDKEIIVRRFCVFVR